MKMKAISFVIIYHHRLNRATIHIPTNVPNILLPFVLGAVAATTGTIKAVFFGAVTALTDHWFTAG